MAIKTFCDHCGIEIKDHAKFAGDNRLRGLIFGVALTGFNDQVLQSIDLCDSCIDIFKEQFFKNSINEKGDVLNGSSKML